MRLLVTGGAGMLAGDLVRLARARGHEVLAYPRAKLDLRDAKAVAAAVLGERPDAVVNLAAYTQVDGAEADEAGATAVNGDGPGHLARATATVSARLVHVSSDYVFPGDDPRPRREDDAVKPRSAYGRSKLAGEHAVAAAGGRFLIVRSAWLYGQHGKNFVDTIRRKAEAGDSLRIVDDQVGSPTWTVSLAGGILDLLATEATGIIHVANRGAVSWWDLGQAIVDELGLKNTVDRIATAQATRPAPRPAYSALDVHRFTELTGRTPLGWRDALRMYLHGALDEEI